MDHIEFIQIGSNPPEQDVRHDIIRLTLNDLRSRYITALAPFEEEILEAKGKVIIKLKTTLGRDMVEVCYEDIPPHLMVRINHALI